MAGAYCTKLLAGSGADVVKVEPPDTRESCRRLGLFVNGQQGVEQSLVHLYLNVGKKSATLDLESTHGADIFRALAKEASVVVESFTPGRLAALGRTAPTAATRAER